MRHIIPIFIAITYAANLEVACHLPETSWANGKSERLVSDCQSCALYPQIYYPGEGLCAIDEEL